MEGNEQLAVIIPMLKQVGAGIAPEQLDVRRRAHHSTLRPCLVT